MSVFSAKQICPDSWKTWGFQIKLSLGVNDTCSCCLKTGWKEAFHGVKISWHLTRAARIILLKCKSDHIIILLTTTQCLPLPLDKSQLLTRALGPVWTGLASSLSPSWPLLLCPSAIGTCSLFLKQDKLFLSLACALLFLLP